MEALKVKVYLHLCNAGPYRGGDLALSGGLGPTEPGPETCWAHFASSALP